MEEEKNLFEEENLVEEEIQEVEETEKIENNEQYENNDMVTYDNFDHEEKVEKEGINMKKVLGIGAGVTIAGLAAKKFVLPKLKSKLIDLAHKWEEESEESESEEEPEFEVIEVETEEETK